MTTMLDLAVAPDSIHRLVRWLDSNQFQIDAERTEGLNHQFGMFRSAGLVVRITADRGDWSVGLATQEMYETHTVDGWRAWSYRQPLAGEPSPLDEQVRFIVTEWLELAEDAQANSREGPDPCA
jgi:hypothetical protein